MRTTMMRAIVALGLLLGGASSAAAQTGIVIPMPKAYFADGDGDGPCAGCLLFSYAAGTTTKQSTYSNSALSSANTNPVVLGSDGRATIYLNPAQGYKFVLAPPTDTDPPASAYYTQDNIIGPYSGVFTVTAADTRGLRVSRTSAEAGLSVTSSGGSGKSYALVSNTSGGMRLQDDADASPMLEFLGNNVTVGLTGSFTVSGGVFSATGFGVHSLSSSGTGANALIVRNTSDGANNSGAITVGNNLASNALSLTAHASSAAFGGPHAVIDSTVGNLYIRATAATGTILFGTGASATVRAQISDTGKISLGGQHAALNDVDVRSSGDGLGGGITVTRGDANSSYLVLNMDDGGASAYATIQAGDSLSFRPLRLQPSGSVVLMPTQPAFMAVNTATDIAVSSGSTVDFDSEVFDVAGNFATDTFTAPVAGIYEFCAGVEFSDNASSGFTADININGALHRIVSFLAQTAGGGSGCVLGQLAASQTALVSVTTTDVSVDIEGSASPRVTWFSGRLVQ